MADHRKILIALAVSLLALTLAAAQQCGTQAGGQLCPDNFCCGQHGYCGNTPDYCGENCQSQCSGGVRDLDAYGIRPGNEQCGTQAGGQLCPDNLCCSQYGYCGDTPPYCGENCQSQCSGGVRNLDAYGIRPGNEQCGTQAGGQLCPDNLCCSQYGYCGDTPPYCGENCQSQCSGGVRNLDAYGIRPGNEQCGTQAGGQLCPDNLCCSQYGYCGDTPPYCGENCQSQCSGGVRNLDAYGIRPGNEQCGTQAGGQLCPDNLCCSQYGYCGDTPPYCGENCQSQCSGGVRNLDAYGIRPGNEQCGTQAGGQLCPDNLCCSQYGFCGDTPPYCGENCQSQCSGGVRDLDAYGIRPGNEQCGTQAGGQLCPDNLCCSQYGYCGDTPPYCGENCQSQCSGGVRNLDAYGIRPGNEQCGTQAGGQLCPDNLCCSQYGYCGDTPPYCGENCQSQCTGSLRATTGNASYYSKYVPSACYGNDISHFPPNRYMAAVSDGKPDLWKHGQACGRHYQIRCHGKGCRNGDAIRIKVVDHCPNGCQGRVFDLSEEAFDAIADKNAGVIKVEYAPIERADSIPWAQKKLIAEVGRIRK